MDWFWLVAAAASFFMRMLMAMAQGRRLTSDLPGPYRCATCGRPFTFFA